MTKSGQTLSVNTIPNLGYTHNNKVEGVTLFTHTIVPV